MEPFSEDKPTAEVRKASSDQDYDAVLQLYQYSFFTSPATPSRDRLKDMNASTVFLISKPNSKEVRSKIHRLYMCCSVLPQPPFLILPKTSEVHT